MVRGSIQAAGEAILRPLISLSGARRQGEVLGEIGHRPWPLPGESWLMGQTWHDLLFAHWPVSARELAPVVPPQLPLDSFEGRAWIGITPFVVRGLRLRGTLPAPVVSSFAEINVRTYVTVAGKPGIYFFSLDAASRSAVFAARRAYRLPYFESRISVERSIDGLEYRAWRSSTDGPPAAFEARYGPRGDPSPPPPGTLEHWLTERYCLYTLDERGETWRGEIHHPPWPLQPAFAQIRHNSMAEPLGLALEGEPLAHFSRRQDVALWPIRRAPHD